MTLWPWPVAASAHPSNLSCGSRFLSDMTTYKLLPSSVFSPFALQVSGRFSNNLTSMFYMTAIYSPFSENVFQIAMIHFCLPVSCHLLIHRERSVSLSYCYPWLQAWHTTGTRSFDKCFQESTNYQEVGLEPVSLPLYSFLVLLFLLFRPAPSAYGGSQDRGQIGAVAASLHHSQSNAGSLSHWARPGIEPSSSWILVGFVNC